MSAKLCLYLMLMLLQNNCIYVITCKNETVPLSNSNDVNKTKTFFLIKKNLKDKSSDLSQLWVLGKLFISESMSHENHQLTYRCCQLNTAGKIHSTWIFNNSVNLKLTNNGPIYQISQIFDIENISRIDNLEEHVNNSSL